MMPFRSLQTLKKKFFKFEDVVEFHYELMNIVMLVREKHQEGGWFCHCDKYRHCCLWPLVRRCFRQRRPRFCALRKMQTFCYKRNAVDNMSVLEFLDRHSENRQKLNQLVKLMWPFIRKIFFIHKYSLDFFDDVYVWTHRDWNTFETCQLSLREIIDYDMELIKLNGPERYFAFTFGQ